MRDVGKFFRRSGPPCHLYLPGELDIGLVQEQTVRGAAPFLGEPTYALVCGFEACVAKRLIMGRQAWVKLLCYYKTEQRKWKLSTERGMHILKSRHVLLDNIRLRSKRKDKQLTGHPH